MSAFFDLSLFADLRAARRLARSDAALVRVPVAMTAAGLADRALTGGVALLERAMGYTLGWPPAGHAGDAADPTPCAGWDLRRSCCT